MSIRGFSQVSRRRFMGALGLMGVGSVGAALTPSRLPGQQSVAAVAADRLAASAAVPGVRAQGEMTADEMDAMHEAGVRVFPVMIEGSAGSRSRSSSTATSRSFG